MYAHQHPAVGALFLAADSPAREAAIDQQVYAGDEGGGGAEQEDRRADDFLDRRDARHRSFGGEDLQLLGDLGPLIHRCQRVAWADGVDAHATPDPLHRQNSC